LHLVAVVGVAGGQVIGFGPGSGFPVGAGGRIQGRVERRGCGSQVIGQGAVVEGRLGTQGGCGAGDGEDGRLVQCGFCGGKRVGAALAPEKAAKDTDYAPPGTPPADPM